jgi:hypothetical protein
MTSITLRVKRVRRALVLERVLLAVGLICVTWYAFASAQAKYDEHEARAAVVGMLESAKGAEGAESAEGAGAESAGGTESTGGAMNASFSSYLRYPLYGE